MRRWAPILGLLLSTSTQGQASLRPVELRGLGEPRIERIRIEHERHKPITNRQLRAAMALQEGERFQRRLYRSDLSTIENLLRSRGYMDARVARRRFYLDPRNRLHLHLKVDSGELWHVASVTIEALDTVSVAPVRHTRLRLRAGDVFRYGEVLRDERSLLGALNGDGYAHAAVRNRLDFDGSRGLVAVRFEVQTGRRMYFGPLQVDGEQLQTRASLIESRVTFREGELYDPEAVRETRNDLARTGLFRSVTLETPPPAAGDSLQPVVLRLQERPYRQLDSRVFINNSEPGVSARLQHANFLGRGNRIGTDASLGQPLEGLTVFLTELDLLGSHLDLTLSAGFTREWGQTRVFADATDPTQLDLLTANHAMASELAAAADPGRLTRFLSGLVYQYPSIERLWQMKALFSRRWQGDGDAVYHTNLTANWTASRNRPIRGRTIELQNGEAFDLESPEAALPYDDGIRVDGIWRTLLTDRARALNFEVEVQRDARDNQISPTRGHVLRAAGLFAWEFSAGETRVLDGEVEARNYLRLGRHLVWAQAVRAVLTGSLRRDKQLPQAYWQAFGGEGSVRGVERATILAAGGGRAGANLRSELRARLGRVGLVAFWDRAGVWRTGGQAQLSDMTDGYGGGLRWDPGIPLRFDVGWSDGFRERRLYMSVGQAF